MSDTYSTYEAKARFSEILRQVREGKTITVSYHGEPVAEIRPIGGDGTALERRLRVLQGLGILVTGDEPRDPLKRIVRRPGALARFLAERDE